MKSDSSKKQKLTAIFNEDISPIQPKTPYLPNNRKYNE